MATRTILGTGSGIFRRKPIEEEPDDARSQLTRTLGVWQLTAIGLGAIIGAGIFSLAGSVARDVAGPAVGLSFVIAGVASAAAAFSYAEFAGLIPRAGSAYTYGYAVLGEFPGWMIGWDLLLEYTAIVAVVAISISSYIGFLVQQFGVHLPTWMLGAPGTGPGHVVDLFAMLLCLLIAFLLNLGIRTAARIETVLVVVKVTIVVAVIVVGAFYFRVDNVTPYMPFGFAGAATGAATVFFAVFGYDAMSTAAEESKDAQRSMPKAIVFSLVIAMVLYLLACTVLTGMVHYPKLTDSAFADAFNGVGLPAFATVVAVGAVLGIITVLFSFTLGASRIWYAISRDGLLPRWFSATDPRTHSPYRVTWLVGIAAALLAGVLPIVEVAELTNIGILLAFVVVCAAVIVLRRRQPELPRTFRCPWVPWVPLIGIGFSLWLVTNLQPLTWLRFVVWFLIGCVVYGLYGFRHSRLAARDAGSRGSAGGNG
jgi:APA family basic amino acid/polyamine antiporter